jgi:hypothetical protein
VQFVRLAVVELLLRPLNKNPLRVNFFQAFPIG